MTYRVGWQLEYRTGLLRTESPDGESIRAMPKEYKGIRLIEHLPNNTMKPIVRIDIPLNGKAVFYRIKHQDVNVLSGQTIGSNSTDGIVFGYVTEQGSRRDGKLWLYNGQNIIDCPLKYVDQSAIDLAAEA